MNLHDPIPGPILIVGDPGIGKTILMQTIASAAGKMHQPEELQLGALTRHPEEWSGLETIPNNVGVFPLYHRSSEYFILSLASWAHGNKTSRQSVLLFLDDLEAVNNLDFDARQNLRWLLLRGPARRVWPIITLNPDRMQTCSAMAGCLPYPHPRKNERSTTYPPTGSRTCRIEFTQYQFTICPS